MLLASHPLKAGSGRGEVTPPRQDQVGPQEARPLSQQGVGVFDCLH